MVVNGDSTKLNTGRQFQKMNNYKKYFDKEIRNIYPGNFGEILTETENNYKVISVDTKFAANSKNPLDKRLDFCSYFLALIKTLDHRGEQYEKIRLISLQIVTEYVKPKNKIQEFIKRIPAKFIGTWFAVRIINSLNKKVRKNEHKDGFIANIITDKQETLGLGYGIDIIECGICKLFSKHNFDKYAPILCEVDKITSNLAGLTLVRTGTIANGAMKCDFRFRRIKKANETGLMK